MNADLWGEKMSQKEKCRPSVSGTHDGRGKQDSQTPVYIVRQSGFPVNGVFSCTFVRQVFDLLSQPITVEQIATITGSTIDRVRLALNDLAVCGVRIGVYSNGS